MNNSRNVTFEDKDYNLEPFYRKIRDLCDENGIYIKKDFSISECTDFRYLPQKYYGKNGEKISYIFLTYYEAGFEVLGEIKIDCEKNSFSLDFPNWGVFAQSPINA
jgi:hypothetical protein